MTFKGGEQQQIVTPLTACSGLVRYVFWLLYFLCERCDKGRLSHHVWECFLYHLQGLDRKPA